MGSASGAHASAVGYLGRRGGAAARRRAAAPGAEAALRVGGVASARTGKQKANPGTLAYRVRSAVPCITVRPLLAKRPGLFPRGDPSRTIDVRGRRGYGLAAPRPSFASRALARAKPPGTSAIALVYSSTA